MLLTPEIIAAIGTSIIAPIIAYLKVRTDTQKRTESRNTEIALIKKRLDDCEEEINTIDELKESINRMSNAITKIQTMLEMYIKHHDRD